MLKGESTLWGEIERVNVEIKKAPNNFIEGVKALDLKTYGEAYED